MFSSEIAIQFPSERCRSVGNQVESKPRKSKKLHPLIMFSLILFLLFSVWGNLHQRDRNADLETENASYSGDIEKYRNALGDSAEELGIPRSTIETAGSSQKEIVAFLAKTEEKIGELKRVGEQSTELVSLTHTVCKTARSIFATTYQGTEGADSDGLRKKVRDARHYLDDSSRGADVSVALEQLKNGLETWAEIEEWHKVAKKNLDDLKTNLDDLDKKTEEIRRLLSRMNAHRETGQGSTSTGRNAALSSLVQDAEAILARLQSYLEGAFDM